MKTTNIAELKKHLIKFLELARKGEKIEVCKRSDWEMLRGSDH